MRVGKDEGMKKKKENWMDKRMKDKRKTRMSREKEEEGLQREVEEENGMKVQQGEGKGTREDHLPVLGVGLFRGLAISPRAA